MARTSKDVAEMDILAAALKGLEAEKARIDEQIAIVKQRLGGKPARTAPKTAAQEKPAKKKRVLSAAARKRIAAAQKKRWAEYRKQSGEEAAS